MSNPGIRFDATLFFATPARLPDWAAFRSAANARLDEIGIALGPAEEAGADSAGFFADSFHLHIARAGKRLEAERFAGALGSAYTRLCGGDAQALLRDHADAVTLSCPDGLPRDGTPPEDLFLRVAVLHRAALALDRLSAEAPLMIHWGQSDQLLTRADFLRTAEDDFPVSLVTHPGLFTGDGGDGSGGETPPLGFVARQSALFCGKTLICEPTALVGPGVAFAAVDFLLFGFLDDRFELTDGATIPVTGGLDAELRHLPPDADFPQGRISVRLAASDTGATQDAPDTARQPGAPTPAPENEPARGFAELRQAAVAARPGDHETG